MPVERGALGQVDARLVAVVVEEAELDALRVLGEEREVRPVARPRSRRAGTARRARPSSPELHGLRVEVRDELDRRRVGARRTRAVDLDVDLAAAARGAARSARGRTRAAPRRPRSGRASSARTSRAPAGRARRPRRTPRSARTPAADPRASPARCRVDVVGEELERPPLAVLLAHEEQRRLRREQDDGGAQPQLVGRAAGRRRRGCRPGRGSALRRRAARQVSRRSSPASPSSEP